MDNSHSITRETGGKNELSWIKPKCSCGWVGETQYAYEDYQRHAVDQDVFRHISEAKKRSPAA